MSCTSLRTTPLVFPTLPGICSGIWGRLLGLNRSLILDLQGVPKGHARDVPFSLCSCFSKKGTESSTDPGGVLGFLFVHMQILLQIVDSLFYY